VAFRRKLYRSVEEIQADLDEFMAWYNTERTNQGSLPKRWKSCTVVFCFNCL
jgi:hypothetical protein